MLDSGDSVGIRLVLVILLLSLSAFFSSAETALTTVSKMRIRTLAEAGDKKAITQMCIRDSGNTDYTPSETVKKISTKIASDTGIYKEGQYVDKVGTDGGVIQPPKTKPAETQKEETESAKETKETAEEGYQYVYVKDENGERVRKKIKMETRCV